MHRCMKVAGAAMVAAAAFSMPVAAGMGPKLKLDMQLAAAMSATAKYANHLPLAKKNGYQIITQMIPTWAITS